MMISQRDFNVLGLDIAKDKIDCALLHQERYQYITISNNVAGFAELLDWLQCRGIDLSHLHVCCEVTNVYYLAVAKYFYERQIKVSVINPSVIKHYAQMRQRRVKTDKQDAKLIADYCALECPILWQPENEDKAYLMHLIRRADQLTEMLTMEKNRLYVADERLKHLLGSIIATLQEQLDFCRAEIQRVIDSHQDMQRKQQIISSIVGVGKTTSQILLAVLLDIDKFPSARHLISWLGLSPVVRQSGKFSGVARLSKMGDKMIRKALYLPAKVACTRSKLWRSWFDEQIKTKPAKKVYVQMMVKIVKYAYYCVKNDQLFNPDLHRFEPQAVTH